MEVRHSILDWGKDICLPAAPIQTLRRNEFSMQNLLRFTFREKGSLYRKSETYTHAQIAIHNFRDWWCRLVKN
jgi:hypothetical protein